MGAVLNGNDSKESQKENKLNSKEENNKSNHNNIPNNNLSNTKKDEKLNFSNKLNNQKQIPKLPGLHVSENYEILKYKQKNKIDPIEYSLPEINIGRGRKIEEYYPYFMKANLIELSPFIEYKTMRNNANAILTNPILKTKNQNVVCMDPICEICDINNRINCLQCMPGHFLLDNKCYIACPDNFIADVYERKCLPINTFSRVTYLKAFSTGSCKNMCGKITVDCSCQPDCKQNGNCCSDYRECDLLIKKNMDIKSECNKNINNCELCSDIVNKKCGQCMAGFYLRNEECVNFCSEGDRVIKESMVCAKTNKCLVENCLECEDGNPSVCNQCFNGFFLYNNICNLVCPGKYRADRMNWTCLEPTVFSWYWVFPSKSSCRNKCDIPYGQGRDCSCREDCVSYGNCCQDVEDYCYKFIISSN